MYLPWVFIAPKASNTANPVNTVAFVTGTIDSTSGLINPVRSFVVIGQNFVKTTWAAPDDGTKDWLGAADS